MADLMTVQYKQTGKSSNLNELGMREMQARAYDARDAQYLLLKAPPASGKSRALMFLGLDKLHHQGLKKVIVAVPEMSIGGSFKDTDLKSAGFFADWKVQPSYNLCVPGGEDRKVKAFIRFMSDPDADVLICTHATLRYAYKELGPRTSTTRCWRSMNSITPLRTAKTGLASLLMVSWRAPVPTL